MFIILHFSISSVTLQETNTSMIPFDLCSRSLWSHLFLEEPAPPSPSFLHKISTLYVHFLLINHKHPQTFIFILTIVIKLNLWNPQSITNQQKQSAFHSKTLIQNPTSLWLNYSDFLVWSSFSSHFQNKKINVQLIMKIPL